MLFKKVNTSGKLYLLVLIMFLFIILIGYIGIRQLKTVTHNSQSLYVDRVIPIMQLTTIRYSYAFGILYSINQIQNHEINFHEGQSKLTEAVKTIHSNWKAYKTTYLTSEEKIQIKKLEIDMQQTDTIVRKLNSILTNQDYIALNKLISDKILDHNVSKIIYKLNRLVELQRRVGEKLYKSNNQLYSSTLTRFYFLLAVCLLITYFFSFYIVQNVKSRT